MDLYGYHVFACITVLSFVFEKRAHIIPHYTKQISIPKKYLVGPIRSRQSYFFVHEEIKKPLQSPEILGLLKGQKKKVSKDLS